MSIIFLLIITLSQPDVMIFSPSGSPFGTQEKVVVSSPESAAIVMWQKNQFPGFNSRYSGELYKIDLRVGTVEKVKIPKIMFSEG